MVEQSSIRKEGDPESPQGSRKRTLRRVSKLIRPLLFPDTLSAQSSSRASFAL
ncbi:protein of unknown function [Candidatus Nitrospira inopinata]|uniref:Uncharacterized protein n=1 Tax=Candidatus Nitrospira inopinata TaxID=1715989 RepID=A0A0S4KQV4_9BACT|nr:protein of unknown function [Candidatus Nitrospira inopinata]